MLRKDLKGSLKKISTIAWVNVTSITKNGVVEIGGGRQGFFYDINQPLLDALRTKNIVDIYLFTDDLHSGQGSTERALVERLKAEGFTVHGCMTPADLAWCVGEAGKGFAKGQAFIPYLASRKVENLLNPDSSLDPAFREINASLASDHPASLPWLISENIKRAAAMGEREAYPSKERTSAKYRLFENRFRFHYGWYKLAEQIVVCDDDQVFLREIVEAEEENKKTRWYIPVAFVDTSARASYSDNNVSGDNSARFKAYFQQLSKISFAKEADEKESDFAVKIQDEEELDAVINKVYFELYAIAKNYLKHNDREEKNNNPKKEIFLNLKIILNPFYPSQDYSNNSDAKIKFNCIVDAANYLLKLKHAEIAEHRTDWRIRYLINALSWIFLIPAAIRAYDSHKVYGTCEFWKPSSEKAWLGVKDEVKNVIESGRALYTR